MNVIFNQAKSSLSVIEISYCSNVDCNNKGFFKNQIGNGCYRCKSGTLVTLEEVKILLLERDIKLNE